ncbi:hypothetical protein NG799_19030 [Laspinema sp. D1]|uniref:Uncharacterized protein n=1 Tax=Laspinema palackyanum D2a TaxID=2953684 RepID=A0ABT2MY30_9CYAN|nr:hypothetical protein [Laspinema sp. D2a]
MPTSVHPLVLIHLPGRSQQNLVHVHPLGLRQCKPNSPPSAAVTRPIPEDVPVMMAVFWFKMLAQITSDRNRNG